MLRRNFALIASAALVAAMVTAPRAQAQTPWSILAPYFASHGLRFIQSGALYGTWWVACPAGHVDEVGGITRNHDSEKCGRKAINGGFGLVVCPRGHADLVEGHTAGHRCSKCHLECRQ